MKRNVKEAMFRLKDDLDMYGDVNMMITVRRADLALVVQDMFFKSDEWNNQAALGYTIKAAEEMGLSEEVISKLVSEMKWAFDSKTLEEAADVYRRSSY